MYLNRLYLVLKAIFYLSPFLIYNLQYILQRLSLVNTFVYPSLLSSLLIKSKRYQFLIMTLLRLQQSIYSLSPLSFFSINRIRATLSDLLIQIHLFLRVASKYSCKTQSLYYKRLYSPSCRSILYGSRLIAQSQTLCCTRVAVSSLENISIYSQYTFSRSIELVFIDLVIFMLSYQVITLTYYNFLFSKSIIIGSLFQLIQEVQESYRIYILFLKSNLTYDRRDSPSQYIFLSTCLSSIIILMLLSSIATTNQSIFSLESIPSSSFQYLFYINDLIQKLIKESKAQSQSYLIIRLYSIISVLQKYQDPLQYILAILVIESLRLYTQQSYKHQLFKYFVISLEMLDSSKSKSYTTF